MITFRLNKIWLLSAFLLLGVAALAQDTKPSHASGPAHAHKSNHGGVVKSAGDYHIELVTKSNQYLIYLLDAGEHPISLKGVTGLAILRDGDRTVHTQTLTPTFNTHFVLHTNGTAHSAVIVNFMVNNQNITAKFEKTGSSAMIFFCPQKCTGSDSNIAGICPKCGTALADRRLLAKE
ncbi:hypothetical protein AAE02nite_02050 [Adhaeribacter aerolatus]|uniref:Uncharacterized protein n=1 Tax=Adhaeribacter aerolatus TaxID=670289 RepID=A0A512AS61_9BACT|nr:hypothetical protein [Adhaeribacter aerolatus]GEO02541.1 hypothetical protein AAE02nite_02050 [Adhaeribacter aerolatus]